MNKDKILVVEDEQLIFDSIEDTLANEYQLYHAENGAVGLRLLAEHHPILIILDIRMPVMDGFEFLKKINISMDDPYSVIVLSGHSGGSEIGLCYNMGITSFLRKPFNVYEMKGLIKQCIHAKKQYQILLQERQYIRAIFDYSMDMILVIDNKFNIVDSNQAVENACGYGMLALRGVPFKNLFAFTEQFEAIAAFLTTGQAFPETISLLHRSGKHFHAVLKVAVLHDSSGNPTSCLPEGENSCDWATAIILLTPPTYRI